MNKKSWLLYVYVIMHLQLYAAEKSAVHKVENPLRVLPAGVKNLLKAGAQAPAQILQPKPPAKPRLAIK